MDRLSALRVGQRIMQLAPIRKMTGERRFDHAPGRKLRQQIGGGTQMCGGAFGHHESIHRIESARVQSGTQPALEIGGMTASKQPRLATGPNEDRG